MFKPDNDKIKTIIFHLLKKEPTVYISTPTWKYGNKEVSISYPFHPYVQEKENWTTNENMWRCNINIFNSNAKDENSYYITGMEVDLTEKEAMEVKWALDDITSNLQQNIFNELAEFALEEIGTQDELIDD